MNAPSAIGMRQQILDTAGVPKGSFYHWFRSKEQFDETLLERHFEGYLQQTDALLAAPGHTAVARLLAFFGR